MNQAHTKVFMFPVFGLHISRYWKRKKNLVLEKTFVFILFSNSYTMNCMYLCIFLPFNWIGLSVAMEKDSTLPISKHFNFI